MNVVKEDWAVMSEAEDWLRGLQRFCSQPQPAEKRDQKLQTVPVTKIYEGVIWYAFSLLICLH
jgi:hypothetical protein